MSRASTPAVPVSLQTAVRKLPASPRSPRDSPDLAALWTDPGARAAVIGTAAPFVGWPPAALQRLALAAKPVRFAAAEALARRGAPAAWVSIVVRGAVESAMATSDGRRLVLKLDAPGLSYGLVSLIDGGDFTNDMIFTEPGVALRVPCAAVRAELTAEPALWESVARLVNARGRYYLDQIGSYMLDSLPVRAASLLLGLLEPTQRSASAPITVSLRLTQARFAEMLGVTRQALSPLLRGFVRDGLLHWQYGRVSLLDPHRLRDLAEGGVEVDRRAVPARRPRAG